MTTARDREAHYARLADVVEAGDYEVVERSVEVRPDYQPGLCFLLRSYSGCILLYQPIDRFASRLPALHPIHRLFLMLIYFPPHPPLPGFVV